ncbi:hypothetical protein BRETT_003375 [Brettanomyces bruxellensis]|uniref:RRM domain-containing protein n=1 Tax=Dekkera bruxellensis TaxID=5007 RepID=A0A871R9P3_DEKBR|nr:uncharacterized protein BRETT_003375 [Brettanomyces bruxellensis]QOU23183.1 hypothetical protein BRETT_003375 [Brettanomyces bruxellensis]
MSHADQSGYTLPTGFSGFLDSGGPDHLSNKQWFHSQQQHDRSRKPFERSYTNQPQFIDRQSTSSSSNTSDLSPETYNNAVLQDQQYMAAVQADQQYRNATSVRPQVMQHHFLRSNRPLSHVYNSSMTANNSSAVSSASSIPTISSTQSIQSVTSSISGPQNSYQMSTLADVNSNLSAESVSMTQTTSVPITCSTFPTSISNVADRRGSMPMLGITHSCGENQYEAATSETDISNTIAPSRTVYLGNVPPYTRANKLLDHVRSGVVESLRIIPSKNCAFVSFLDEKAAMLFHSDAILKRLTIDNHEIKVGWGKPTAVPPVVASCVARYNATRNVYLGNLPSDTTEQELVSDLSEYGEIETVKILSEKRIAFVHFTSILAATRCVQTLPLVSKYCDRKVFYGKDRCAFITKTQQHNAAQYLGLNPLQDNLPDNVDRDQIASALVKQSNAAAMIATAAGGSSNLGNRTIYLGNLNPETTVEEICNAVRGGILQNIRPIPERHVCFVTFIDPISAAQFFAMSSIHGLIIHNRKVKVGWGKHSGPLPGSISLAVANGASRNIYIGGLDKIPEIAFTQEKLYHDFKPFGDIEQINFFEQKHCCFVNFTNISNAVKAIDGIHNNPDYEKCKINFGKDRCGNTPRHFQSSRSRCNSHKSSSSSTSASTTYKLQKLPLSFDYIRQRHNSEHYDNNDQLNTGSANSPPAIFSLKQEQQQYGFIPNSSSGINSSTQNNNLNKNDTSQGYTAERASQCSPLGIITDHANHLNHSY